MNPVGADLRVCPDDSSVTTSFIDANTGFITAMRLDYSYNVFHYYLYKMTIGGINFSKIWVKDYSDNIFPI